MFSIPQTVLPTPYGSPHVILSPLSSTTFVKLKLLSHQLLKHNNNLPVFQEMFITLPKTYILLIPSAKTLQKLPFFLMIKHSFKAEPVVAFFNKGYP